MATNHSAHLMEISLNAIQEMLGQAKGESEGITVEITHDQIKLFQPVTPQFDLKALRGFESGVQRIGMEWNGLSVSDPLD